ncbi:MAG: HEAT repeat domain-containing protein [Deltaproteobacteria bacterium]|jgi:HEAT repeat protein|nr:HEAT repeat domain-containing protein [Deltaproteobacteria bacterium]MBW2540522.1 HEAT repeat domain-containing protein [Deltaproteobacteria bacterium]
MSLEFDERDRESIARDIRDGDEEVRRLAVERVDALPAEEAIRLLIECLGDSSWRVRKASIERLVARGETNDVTNALVRALGDGENPGRRNAAVDALIHSGAKAIPALLAERTSSDVDVRKLVVDALAGIADSSASESLQEMLEDPDPNVRASAADALGAIGGDGVPAALIAKAADSDEDQLVRFSAIHALNALEFPVRASELGTVLDDPILGHAGLSLVGRAEGDAEGIAILLKALGSGSRSTREASIRSLLRIVGHVGPEQNHSLMARIRAAALASDRVIASAVERLPEADLPMKLILIQFLGIVATPSAVIPILLAGRDEALSEASLSTLESLGDVAEEIIDAEWSNLDPESRRDACLLFGGITGEKSAARLLSSLEDFSSETRSAAARSIGRRGLDSGLAPLVARLAAAAIEDDFEGEEELAAITDGLIALAAPGPRTGTAVTARAIELLIACLDGAAERVRLAVATVIGRIGRSEDSQIVSFLMKDASSSVRRASVEALARLEPGTAAEPLRLALADESPMVRIAAARALGASENIEVVDDLKRLADDEDSGVRAAAVRSVIFRFAQLSADESQSEMLGVIDTALADDPQVALGALEALCEAGGVAAERAAGILERSEPELVRAAVRCIGMHSELDDLEALFPLIGHPDWSVRAEAIQTLSDRRSIRAMPSILRRLEVEQDDFVRDVTLSALKRLEGEV